jgi:hypothetical protein
MDRSVDCKALINSYMVKPSQDVCKDQSKDIELRPFLIELRPPMFQLSYLIV